MSDLEITAQFVPGEAATYTIKPGGTETLGSCEIYPSTNQQAQIASLEIQNKELREALDGLKRNYQLFGNFELVDVERLDKIIKAPPPEPTTIAKILEIVLNESNWDYTDPNDGYNGGWKPHWVFKGTSSLRSVVSELIKERGM